MLKKNIHMKGVETGEGLVEFCNKVLTKSVLIKSPCGGLAGYTDVHALSGTVSVHHSDM